MPISLDSPLLQAPIWEWLTEGETRRFLYAKNVWFNRVVDVVRHEEAAGRDPMPCVRDALEKMALEIDRLVDQIIQRATLESQVLVLYPPRPPCPEIG